jgi:hypothetical protein
MHQTERLSKMRLLKIPNVTHVRHGVNKQPAVINISDRKHPHMPCLFRHYLAALIFVSFFSASSAAQATWQPFTDREAGFTISFPGEPTYGQVSIAQSGDPEETYKFQYGEHFLSITFAPLLSIPRNSVELSRAYAEVTKELSRNGTLIRQEKLPDGGRQYYNVSNETSGRLHMLTRIYIHSGRHYQLVYGTFAPAGVNERVANRFFSSFRFIDNQLSRGASAHDRLPNGSTRRDPRRSGWYVLRGSDREFVAEFPGKPEYSLTPQPELGTEVHKFSFFFGENLFVLSYWKVPGANARPEEILQRIVSAHAAGERAKGEVLKQVRLLGGGYEVESQGIFNNTVLHSRVRFFVDGARIYTLSTMTPNLPGPNKSDLDRFFASFHFNRP